MISDLNEIRLVRKRLNLTQQELAGSAGVSQSLVAKIESGRIDPSYTNAKKIFTALRQVEENNDADVRKVMQRRVISVSPGSRISRAIEMIRKHSISQLPVVEAGQAVGLLSESIILEALLEKKVMLVKDIMQEPPPIVSQYANIRIVSQLLRYYPIVLVSEKGRIKGVITKSDLLTTF